MTEAPLCECGCGRPVTRAKRYPHDWNRFATGHASMGRVLSAETRAKIGNAQRKYNGQRSHSWRGGRRITQSGYVDIYAPNHPRARVHYVFEHILVAEKMLGRPLLPDETVHHKDHNKTNNDPSNLEVLTRSEHSRFHSRSKERKGEYRLCPICGKEFYVRRHQSAIRKTCSFKCAAVLYRHYYTGKPRDYRPSESEKMEVLLRCSIGSSSLEGSRGTQNSDTFPQESQ